MYTAEPDERVTTMPSGGINDFHIPTRRRRWLKIENTKYTCSTCGSGNFGMARSWYIVNTCHSVVSGGDGGIAHRWKRQIYRLMVENRGAKYRVKFNQFN